MPDQVGKVKTTGTRKWEERKSSSPETVEPPAKFVRSIDNQVMASPSEAELETAVRRESSNTSLEDIKEILDNIQDTIARILHENGQLRNELKELKASLKSKDREVQSLQESLSKTCERNKALEQELGAAKVKIDKQEDEIYYLLDNLDSLEQYTRKNSLEIHGVPKEAYSSTEEAVLAIANALEVDISSNDIEISHHLKRRNNNTAIIVKFANHKHKTKLYKARTRLKSVKTSSIFPRCPATIPEFKDRIFINENLTGHRRFVMGQANKMRRDGLLLSCWSLDGKIFVKTSPEGAPTRIFSEDDLKKL